MGLYPFVSKDQFLACMKSFGQETQLGTPIVPHDDAVDNGFVMNGVLHSPTDLCTHGGTCHDG